MYSSKQRRGKGGEEKLHAPKKQKKRGGIPAGSDFLNNKTQVSRLFLHRATYGNGLKFVLIFPGMWKKFFSIFFRGPRKIHAVVCGCSLRDNSPTNKISGLILFDNCIPVTRFYRKISCQIRKAAPRPGAGL